MASSGGSAEAPALALVGLGFRAGEHLTLAGHDALGRSRWIGFFGLPPQLRDALGPYASADVVDLDRQLRSDFYVEGFTWRMARLAAAAAREHGRAAVAVAGHPVIANPAAAALAQAARQAGVRLSIVGAPSALDSYAEHTGNDPVAAGSVLLDARALLGQAYAIDPRLTLVLWNAGYLAADGRRLLAEYLIRRAGADWPVQVYHTGAGGDRVEVYQLGRAEAWTASLSPETTLVVAGRP